MSLTCVFMASSLDGFIAGPNNELDWLVAEGAEDTFTPFLATVGAMLMGRGTFDTLTQGVLGPDGHWPYGELPVLIATRRKLDSQIATVSAVSGGIGEMLAEAKGVAGERDVYLDGGALVRSALEEDLVDRITLTVMPIVLGEGISLFAGSRRRHRLQLLASRPLGGGLVELNYAMPRVS